MSLVQALANVAHLLRLLVRAVLFPLPGHLG